MATDNFNRSDSGSSTGFGTNWTNIRDGSASNSLMEILSQRASIAATSFSWRLGFWNAATIGANQFSEADVFTSDTTDMIAGVFTRVSADGNTFYWAGANSATTLQMRRVVAGVSTNIGSASYSHVTGDTYRLEVSGTTLNFYVNGVLQIGPITDSNIASGQPGIGAFYTSVPLSFDDWEGAEIVASSYTLSVENAASASAGQSITIDAKIPITTRQSAGEGFDVGLLFDQAYVLPVQAGLSAGEAQAIPFALTQIGVDVASVGAGQFINTLFNNGIEYGQSAGAGQSITLFLESDTQLPVVGAQSAGQPSNIVLTAAGVGEAPQNIVYDLHIAMLHTMAYPIYDMGHLSDS